MASDIDVSRLSDERLERLVREKGPTEHLRTKTLDELNIRHKKAEAKASNKILRISKATLIFAIIAALAAVAMIIIEILT